MPPLLRRLFLEAANGGFGPRRGILGVRGHGLTYNGDWTDLLHVYRAFSPRMPREMLWLFDWGCAIWSLVDCSRPEGQMWVWDPNGAEDPSPANSLFRQAMTLTDWLAAWLHGHAVSQFGRRQRGEPIGGPVRHREHSAALVYRASCRWRQWSGLVRPPFGETGASRS